MRNLYMNFKKRVLSFVPEEDSSASSSPSSDNENIDVTPGSPHMLYLISNMMSIYQEGVEKQANTLIYWPFKQDEWSIRSCSVDCRFERTNVKNVFHLVNIEVLKQHLQKSPSSNTLLQFKPCVCHNHRHDIVFDWQEFIPYDFVNTLYQHLLHDPIHGSTLFTLSSSYSIKLPTTERIFKKYLSFDRLRREHGQTQYSVYIKPMNLSENVKQNQELFDTFKVCTFMQVCATTCMFMYLII